MILHLIESGSHYSADMAELALNIKNSSHNYDNNGDNDFLKVLGERVRGARNTRGMTRKALARDSGVSERYLAQLESGQGNTSILLLRQISAALHLPLAELLREGSGDGAELALITGLLRRLPQKKLAEVSARLARDYGGSAERRRGRIALIGLRGAGKSTLGSRLA